MNRLAPLPITRLRLGSLAPLAHGKKYFVFLQSGTIMPQNPPHQYPPCLQHCFRNPPWTSEGKRLRPQRAPRGGLPPPPSLRSRTSQRFPLCSCKGEEGSLMLAPFPLPNPQSQGGAPPPTRSHGELTPLARSARASLRLPPPPPHSLAPLAHTLVL